MLLAKAPQHPLYLQVACKPVEACSTLLFHVGINRLVLNLVRLIGGASALCHVVFAAEELNGRGGGVADHSRRPPAEHVIAA